jgi:hypothetical protein
VPHDLGIAGRLVPHDLEIAWRMVPHNLGIAGRLVPHDLGIAWRMVRIVCSVLCAALRLCRWHCSAHVAVVGGPVAGGGLNGGYANIDINRDGVELDGYVVPEAKFPLRLMLETLWDSKWLR